MSFFSAFVIMMSGTWLRDSATRVSDCDVLCSSPSVQCAVESSGSSGSSAAPHFVGLASFSRFMLVCRNGTSLVWVLHLLDPR